MYADEDFEVTSGPILDNLHMRGWAATNLYINPETTISYAMHVGAAKVVEAGQMDTKRGTYASLVQRHRCWISRSIRHNNVETIATLAYTAN